MIEINLLPEEQKIKKVSDNQFNFILSFVIVALFIILILINIYVISFATIKNIQLSNLNKKWQALEPERKKVEELREQTGILSQDAKAIQQFIQKRISCSDKINKLSMLLPTGVWFNEISLNANKDFVLKGSVVSLKKEEMSLINLFLTNLKQDKTFFGDFQALDLSSVQRRILGGYEVVDFVFTGSMKTK